jgi:SAM-dependent methyltransferase
MFTMPSLLEQFGNIDIYLFDQILRDRISSGMTVLDAGCGTGRNLIYPPRSGYEVFGTDTDPAAIDVTRRLAASLSPALPAGNFRSEPVENMSFTDAFADEALLSATHGRTWRRAGGPFEDDHRPESALHDDVGSYGRACEIRGPLRAFALSGASVERELPLTVGRR